MNIPIQDLANNIVNNQLTVQFGKPDRTTRFNSIRVPTHAYKSLIKLNGYLSLSTGIALVARSQGPNTILFKPISTANLNLLEKEKLFSAFVKQVIDHAECDNIEGGELALFYAYGQSC
jgi:hypothetical protein